MAWTILTSTYFLETAILNNNSMVLNIRDHIKPSESSPIKHIAKSLPQDTQVFVMLLLCWIAFLFTLFDFSTAFDKVPFTILLQKCNIIDTRMLPIA